MIKIKKAIAFFAQKKGLSKDGFFLNDLVKFLGELTETDYVIIDVFKRNNPLVAKTIAIYAKGDIIPNFEYELKCTPCENVMGKSLCVYKKNIQRLFPKDKLLEDMNVESYIGIPLWDSLGQAIGLIAIMHSKPINDSETLELILQIAANTTSQEIEKLEIEKIVQRRTKELKIKNKQFENELKERKLADEALRESEEKYRLLFDRMPDGVYKSTDEGKFINVNTAMFKMLGYDSKEELLAIDIKTQLYFEISDRESVALKENSKELGIYRMKKKDGSEIWGEDHGWLNYDKTKNVLYHEGIIRDVSDRKKTELELIIAKEKAERNATELNEQKILFESMFNTISDGVVITNINREIIVANNGMKNTFGYEPKELIGKSTQILYDSDNSFNDTGENVFNKKNKKKENTYITYYKNKKNKIFPGETFGAKLYNNDGEWIGNIGIIRDISDRQKMTEDLIITKQTYLDVFNTVSEAIYVQDETGTFIDINKGAENMYGYTRKELIGKNPLLVSAPGLNNIDEVQKKSAKVFKSGISERFDFWAVRKNGEIFPKDVIINKGRYFGKDALITTARDVTLIKRTEQELIIAKEKAQESDRLKSAFLANMSHEIRTPMNGILGFSDLLKTPNLSGEKQQRYIEVIEKSGKRMLNIINDIIDISKIEAGLMNIEIKESNVNEQIEYIYTFFKPEVEAKGMQLYFKNTLPAKEAIIKTDREKLFAILKNLVKNAIKYAKEGSIEFGYVLKMGSESVDEIQNNELEFFVKDTGIGIPKDRQEAIFERFIQSDIIDTMARQGAGLGLSITKAYIEVLGGKIWVESEEGIGSTFYFTLPYNHELKEKNSTKDNEVTDNTENRIKNLKILIAEDDEASEMLLSLHLSDFCNEIIKARTGLEAIEACRNNPDLNLILMDIQMPDLNGYEATRQIRQFNKDVVIIAQTAYGLYGDREKYLDAGCNDYISKPIKKDHLAALIQKHFKK
jgi:hypothetical protein